MSERQDIENKVREFVREELLKDLDDVELTTSTNLLAVGVIDSITIVALRTFVERTFQVHLPDEMQAEDFHSIEALTDTIERLQRDKP